MNRIIANGNQIEARLPCTLEELPVAQQLLPRSVVAECALAQARGRS